MADSKHNIEIGLNFKTAKKAVDDIVSYIERKRAKGGILPKEFENLEKGYNLRQLKGFETSQQQAYARMKSFAAGLDPESMTTRQKAQMHSMKADWTRRQELMDSHRRALGGAGGASGGGFFGGMGGAIGMGLGYMAGGRGIAAGMGSMVGGIIGGGKGGMIGGMIGGIADDITGGYMTNASQNLRWRGMGHGINYNWMRSNADRFQYSGDEQRILIESMLKGRGSMGFGGSKTLEDMMKFGRAFGVETETLASMPGAIRGAGGGDFQKKTAEIFASALASKLERGRIGEYLQETANQITAFAQKTSGVNTGMVSSLMSIITRMGGAFTPAVSGQIMQNVDQAIRNPSGTSGALIYQTMAQTLRQGGFTGNIPLGLMMMQKTGLVPPDLSNFPEGTRGAFGGKGGVYGSYDPKRFLTNLAGNLNQTTSNLPSGMRDLQLGYLGSHFFKDPASAHALVREATKPGGLSDDEVKEFIEDLDMHTEIGLEEVKDSVDAMTVQQKALLDLTREQVGQKLVPFTFTIQAGITSIFELLNDLFGSGLKDWLYGKKKIPTPEEYLKTEEEKRKMDEIMKRMTEKSWQTSGNLTGLNDVMQDIADGRITQGYNAGHKAIDYIPKSNKVKSWLGGTMGKSGWFGDRCGYGAKVENALLGKEEMFCHMASPSNIPEGTQISPGQVLGDMGATGRVRSSSGGSGAHIHREERDIKGKLSEKTPNANEISAVQGQ